ncbi:hypothetical protein KKD81_00980 [Patescibacteria group bacterium]|nr:hypothetical protein [Patescibacteria group bacterium]MBU2159142.1 hypothetical protein [Patescibacteria group bacterium]MBU2220492.1 hypothetical protein [Patescibacteria group bacterium]
MDGVDFPAAQMEAAAIKHQGGEWKTNLSPCMEYMSEGAVLQGIEILKNWSGVFPKANTWVGKNCGVPSLVVRIDCIVDADDVIRPYEIEERPCGLGLTGLCNQGFAENLKRVQASWPAIRWVQSQYRATDDELHFGPGLTLEEAVNHDGMLLVRSRPEETDFHQLEDRSVSSVSREGDKGYGLHFGWWDVISCMHDGDLDWYLTPALTTASVLKPVQGTRSRHIKVHLPHDQKRELQARGVPMRRSDTDSIPQLLKLIRGQPTSQMYRQPFVEPMRLTHQPSRNAIYRIFYGFNLATGDWEPLGGVWMALDSLIVHGTDQTVTGPLLFRE